MALIKCPECKKKISDQCQSCPKCGYPLKQDVCNEDVLTVSSVSAAQAEFIKKPFYKKAWVWIIAGIVLALAIGVIVWVLLSNREIKPKYDHNGKPVFVELTGEVYSNAEDYLGYFVQIKGQVFQVMIDTGSSKGIQVWLDPDTCEQNIMIYYSTEVAVKKGDYISCTGYIGTLKEYKNTFGATLSAPLVYSDDLKIATYIDVMAPTVDSIVPENLMREVAGYSLGIDKVEFSQQETRVYATVKNNGEGSLYVGESIIVQGEKQYNSTINYEANYEDIPYEIVKDVSVSGVIVFPAISAEEFTLTIKAYSSDYDENVDDFVFVISKSETSVVTTATTTTTTTVTATTTTTTKKTTANRNKEALAELVYLHKNSFKVDRQSMRDALRERGFKDGEIEYALLNANIDWYEAALTTVFQYDREWDEGVIDVEILREWLKEDKYTDDEIEYAIDSVMGEQGQCAISYIEEIVADKSVVVTFYDLADRLSDLGYHWTVVEYALNHTSGYYRGEAVSSESERVRLLITYGYTYEAIVDWYVEAFEYSYLEAHDLVSGVMNE